MLHSQLDTLCVGKMSSAILSLIGESLPGDKSVLVAWSY